jgi:Zn-dependent protease
MESGWRVGSLLGIPIYIDSSWFLVLALVTFSNAGDILSSKLSNGNSIIAWSVGFLMAILLFSSVLLHELGHSLVARSQGITVKSITLFLFGGIASIDRESKTPIQAFQVAIAGPLVSFVLFGIFYATNSLVHNNQLASFVTEDLARINLILTLFNLIPGLPLDGGQVLKAIVWQIKRDRLAGFYWAAASGQLIGWFGICFGLFILLLTGSLGALWLALIGWFILRNAQAYQRLTQLQEILLKLTAVDVMNREFRVVNARLTLREFAEEYIINNLTNPIPFYAASEGRYRGLILIADLQLTERSEWETKTLIDIAHPLTTIPSVEEKTFLVDVIQRLESITDNRITVLSPAGAVSGLIDRGDIVRAIALKQNVTLPEGEIKKIKAEGKYPSNLPLGAIAKSIEKEKT